MPELLNNAYHAMTSYYGLFVIAHVLLQLGISARVIMRRLPVGVSLAWILVVDGFPVAGPLLYLVLGELRLGSRRAQRFKQLFRPVVMWLKELDDTRVKLEPGHPGQPFAELAERSLGFPPLSGGKMKLLPSWQVAFDAILEDIRVAEKSVFMEFYIWHPGGRADDVVDALLEAAGRGVDCRLLLDALGSRTFLRGPLARRLREAGVQVHAALPGGIFRLLFVRFDLRLHRKNVVVDGRVAYTGSMNLVDPRCFKQSSGVGQWVDAMARIEGPPVKALAITFLADWSVEVGERIEDLKQHSGPYPLPAAGETVVQAVPSGPAYALNAMERALVMAVYSAREEVILTTPYFVPDEPLQMAIVSAAMRGVSVTLVAPKHVDSKLVAFASNAFYAELIEAGVRVMKFSGGLLHTKSVTVDGEWSLFGSLNLDPRSLHLNFELSLGVYDDQFTQSLRGLQLEYVESSQRLTLDELESRPPATHLVESLARLVAPLL
ncbi:Cardiolipin synthase [Posidoniimonas polymericola]|uniref:Cardiolipin synthase n=1 Tax=Posidoniimonas polymericola TaxID=2528002 RepID=A0A5C5YHR8_9BACT|nr:cardiolipin synthase [Posidoniimonas polymericola]TWT74475.1 Cardiolipin synthase [Posidoniimonas polymericola]